MMPMLEALTRIAHGPAIRRTDPYVTSWMLAYGEEARRVDGMMRIAQDAIEAAKQETGVRYRGAWHIYFEPKPIPASCGVDWTFVHDGFDGAPDAHDNRCGYAASVEAAIAQIDELEERDEQLEHHEEA